jgi:hypothetical protein
MPDSCASSSFGSRTATCLCNNQNILCVDNANNYCYGSISGSTVAVIPIPDAAPSAASSAVSSAVPSAGATANPSMNVNGAPSNAAPTTTPTSGSNQLNTKSLLTVGCAIVAYIATH